VTDKVYDVMFIEYTSPWAGFQLTTLVWIVVSFTPVLEFSLIT
jgi:hypothetical protein